MSKKRVRAQSPEPEVVAGNGLLHRRALLGQGIIYAGAVSTGLAASLTGAAAEPLKEGPWSMHVGSVIPPYQTPSRYEAHVVRTQDNPENERCDSRGATPHQLLKGIISPNGLHFTICHGGVPD